MNNRKMNSIMKEHKEKRAAPVIGSLVVILSAMLVMVNLADAQDTGIDAKEIANEITGLDMMGLSNDNAMQKMHEAVNKVSNLDLNEEIDKMHEGCTKSGQNFMGMRGRINHGSRNNHNNGMMKRSTGMMKKTVRMARRSMM